MRLKKIEVLGFKSFADRQLVVVDERVTGVIGPNGCGKSNIVDAIRWCMGEQSAKHLRGTGMADVIFAGCTSRGPAGMAEVTLTFQNDAEGGGVFEQPEMAITRRLFGDGTSEYLINKVPARLRDITELLMGTGAGTKGYSIIEQGQVGRIVSSKPEDRRHIIDEAAGITRFKAQKAAAERKIEATRQNLARVSDVVAELDGRLGVLRRQAQKAERYKRYREELRDLELWVASHKYLELVTTSAVLRSRHTSLQDHVREQMQMVQQREGEADAKRSRLTEVEATLAERRQTVYDLDNRIRLLGAENDYRRREREGLVQSSTQTRAEADAAQAGLGQLDEELTEIDRQRGELGTGDERNQAVSDLEARHREVDQRVDAAQQEQRTVSAKYSEQRSLAARAESRAQSLEESLASAQGRAVVADTELAELSERHERAGAEVARVAEQVDASQVRLEDLRTERKRLDEQRSTLRQQVASAEVALDTKRAEVHRHRSRLQSLEEIQSRYRGCHSGVQVVMEHQDELASMVSLGAGGAAGAEASPPTPGPVYGILADYVHAPARLETALSAVLGDRLEGVVVDAPAVGARGVDLLKRKQEGRTTFLPRRSRRRDDHTRIITLTEGTMLGWSDPSEKEDGRIGSAFEVVDLSEGRIEDAPESGDDRTADLLGQPGVVGRLEDLVEFSGDLGRLRESLLGHAIVVESLPRALELWEEQPMDAMLVTLDGDRIEPTGVVVGGSPTSLNSALLQQKREIRELQEILESLDAEFEAVVARHRDLAEALAQVERDRERSESDVLVAEKQLVELRGELSRHRSDSDRLEREVKGRRTVRQALDAEVVGQTEELARVRARLAEATTELTSLQDVLARAEEALPRHRAEREEIAGALTEAKVALARWQQETDALERSHDRLTRQIQSERHRITRLREAAEQAVASIAQLDEATEAAARNREELVAQSKDATEAVHDARESFEGLRAQLDELELTTRALRGELDELRQQAGRAELGLRESELEREHLLGDIQERFDVDVREVVIDYHHRALATDAELARQKELKRVLARMGEVNLTAITEYDEVSDRHRYLTEQRGDLEIAISQLQEAIDRINKTTRDRFKETFDAVDERFRQLFPRLFGGGQARLKMTDPSDLLATGVEIEARPPGKQPRTLDLLSGGEKALTAVSLIFAIFLIKPSPFCLLDEVDAPLDDANVARFCGLVRDLAGQTQFIIITHNKVTMETADRLYGVTMEQRGVSKLVSVNLRRAVELAYN